MRRARTQQETEFQKAIKALARIQAEQGVDLGLDKIQQTNTAPNEHQKHVEQHEVDAVLLSLHKPHAVKVRPCTYCKEPFATTYCYVGYCSHHCRVKALAEFGIVLDKVKPIWGDNIEPPAMITPQLLVKMENWARQILTQLDQLRDRSLESLASLTEVEFDYSAEQALESPEAPQIPANPSPLEDGGPPTIHHDKLPILEWGESIF